MSELPHASLQRLNTCHPDLIRVVKKVVETYPIIVPPQGGFRGREEQNAAFERGNSRLLWPNSKHNADPSLAIDLVPSPVNWNDIHEFCYMAGFVIATAQQEGVNLLWGGRWKKIKDYPHFEIVESV